MGKLLVVSLLMALVALTPAPGIPGSANAETISIVVSDNAWVFKNSPGIDQSEAEKLEVRCDPNGNNSQVTYLRFDVAPLGGATITSASLGLYCMWTNVNNTVSVCALNDLANAEQTTETSWSGNLTYATRPDGTGNLPNANTSGPLASVDILAGAGKYPVSFDLTSALPGLLDSDTNSQLTLILYGIDDASSNYASLAKGNYPAPTLTVDFIPNAIPEPGTLALLGMALLGLSFYGWRKRR